MTVEGRRESVVSIVVPPLAEGKVVPQVPKGENRLQRLLPADRYLAAVETLSIFTEILRCRSG